MKTDFPTLLGEGLKEETGVIDPNFPDPFQQGVDEEIVIDRGKFPDPFLDTEPNKAKEVLRLRDETGLPDDILEDALDEVKRKKRKSDFDNLDLEPETKEYILDNPNNAAVLSDPQTAENLNWFVRQGKSLKGSFKKSALQFRADDFGRKIFYKGLESLSPSERATRDRINKRLFEIEKNQKGLNANVLTKGLGIVTETAGSMVNMFAEGLNDAVGLGFAGVGAVTGASAGPLGMAGGAASLGMLKGAFDVELGFAMNEYVNLKDNDGNKLPLNVMRGMAFTAASINAILEKASGMFILKQFPVFGKILDNAPLLRALSRRGIAKAILNNPALKATYGRLGKVIQSSIVEGVTEFTQENSVIVFGELGKMLSEGDLSLSRFGEFAGSVTSQQGRALESGLHGVIGGGGLSAIAQGVGASIDQLKGHREAEKAVDAIQSKERLVEGAVKADELKGSLGKEILESSLNSLAGEDDNVYVSRRDWVSYWRAKNINPDDKAIDVLKQEDLPQYSNSRIGIDFKIPRANLYSVLSKEDVEGLSDFIRDDVDAFNVTEANELIDIGRVEETKGLLTTLLGQKLGKVSEIVSEAVKKPFKGKEKPKDRFILDMLKKSSPKADKKQLKLFATFLEESVGALSEKLNVGKKDIVEQIDFLSFGEKLRNARFVDFLDIMSDFYLDVLSNSKDTDIQAEYKQILNFTGGSKEKFRDALLSHTVGEESSIGSSVLDPMLRMIRQSTAPLLTQMKEQIVFEEGSVIPQILDSLIISSQKTQEFKEDLDKENKVFVEFIKAIGGAKGESKEIAKAINETYDEISKAEEKDIVAKLKSRFQMNREKLRRSLRKEATESVDADPFYARVREMRKDGAYISRKSALDILGSQDLLKEVPSQYLRRKGQNVEKIASEYGFTSDVLFSDFDTISASPAYVMLNDMINKPSRLQAIDNEIDELMKRHEEEFERQQHEEIGASLEAELFDMKSRILIKQIKYMASDKFKEYGKLAKVLLVKRVSFSDIKKQAVHLINNTKIIDLKVGLFQQAYDRVNRRVAELVFEGKKGQQFNDVFNAKVSALILNEAYVRALRAKNKVAKMRAYFSKFDEESSVGKYGFRDMQLIFSVLNQYKLGNINVTEEVDLNDWLNEQGALGYNVEADLPQGDVSFKDLTFEELESVYDFIQQVHHIAKFKNKIGRITEEKGLEAVIAELQEEIIANRILEKKSIKFEPKGAFYGAKTVDSSWFARMMAGMRRLPDVLRSLQGDSDDMSKPIFKRFLYPLQLADNQKFRDEERYSEVLNRIFTPKLKSELINSKHRVISNSGGKKYNRYTAYVVALNLQEDNLDRLISSHYRADTKEESLRQIREVLSVLTPQDIKNVNDILALFDSFWDRISNNELEVNGLRPQKVKATPFIINGRKINGSYYRIKYSNSPSQQEINLRQRHKGLFVGGTSHPQTSQSHLQERVDGAREGYILRMDLDVIQEALKQSVHDLNFRAVLIDIEKMLYPLKNEIIKSQGEGEFIAIEDALKGIILNGFTDSDKYWGMTLNHLRRVAALYHLGFNLQTVAIQPSAYMQTVAQLGTKWASVGMWQAYAGSPMGIYQKFSAVIAMSPSLQERLRRRQHDLATQQGTRRLAPREKGVGAFTKEVSDRIYTVMERVGFGMMVYFDMAAAVPTFLAAKAKAESELGYKDPNMILAYAENMVGRTQGSASLLNMSGMQRNVHTRLFTQFSTYALSMWNMTIGTRDTLRRKLMKAQGIDKLIKSPQAFWEAFMAFAWISVLPTLYFMTLSRKVPMMEEDDDEEDMKEKWQMFIKDLGVTLGQMHLSPIPIIGSPIFFGGKPIVSLELFSNINKSVNVIPKVMQDKRLNRTDYKSMIHLGLQGLGLPKQAWRTGQTIWEMQVEEENMTPMDFIMGPKKEYDSEWDKAYRDMMDDWYEE